MRPPGRAPHRGTVAAATALALAAAVILGLGGHPTPGLASVDCRLAALGAAADGPAVPAASASRTVTAISGRHTSGGTAACQTDLLRIRVDRVTNPAGETILADSTSAVWRGPGPSRAPPRDRLS